MYGNLFIEYFDRRPDFFLEDSVRILMMRSDEMNIKFYYCYYCCSLHQSTHHTKETNIPRAYTKGAKDPNDIPPQWNQLTQYKLLYVENIMMDVKSLRRKRERAHIIARYMFYLLSIVRSRTLLHIHL